MSVRMTLDDLTQEPEYVRLTTKQQTFVRAYLQGFVESKTLDPTAAAQTAYVCTNRESARTHGAHLLSNPKINTCIAKFFGESMPQAFDAALLSAIRNKKLSVAQVTALELFAKRHGLIQKDSDSAQVSFENPATDSVPTKKPIKATPPFAVGDRIAQSGKVYVVESVGADGWPTEATEEQV